MTSLLSTTPSTTRGLRHLQNRPWTWICFSSLSRLMLAKESNLIRRFMQVLVSGGGGARRIVLAERGQCFL